MVPASIVRRGFREFKSVFLNYNFRTYSRFAAGRSSGGDFVPEHVAKARNSMVDKWDPTTTSQQKLAEGGNALPGGN